MLLLDRPPMHENRAALSQVRNSEGFIVRGDRDSFNTKTEAPAGDTVSGFAIGHRLITYFF
jgi:hypothetical protein